MNRPKMQWDWVNRYSIFVYTRFINHRHFNVVIRRGNKGDQNSKQIVLMEYEQRGVSSRQGVAEIAYEKVNEYMRAVEDSMKSMEEKMAAKNQAILNELFPEDLTPKELEAIAEGSFFPLIRSREKWYMERIRTLEKELALKSLEEEPHPSQDCQMVLFDPEEEGCHQDVYSENV